MAADLLRSVVDAIVAVTLAPRCAACARVLDHPLDGPICSDCWLQVHPMRPPLCRTCGGMLPSWRTISVDRAQCAACRRRPGSIDAGCAVSVYEGALREIVHAFKYEGRRTIGHRLGLLMRSAGHEMLADADCAVPVPLHPWRRLRRGFNQATDLARALDVPVVHALWRTRATAAQTGLTAVARRRNVRGAFRIARLLSRQHVRSQIEGRTIVIVDDVWTTGATLNECARVLKEAGAKDVRALTVARALEPR
jgi:ComF family protein